MDANKLDFSKISIITHIRIDGKDRLENLALRNHIFYNACKNLEFINIEDDIKRKVPPMGSEIHHLTNNSGPYNKNLSYNIGFGLTDRPYILFLDADCVIDPNTIFNIVKIKPDILQNDIVYPFEYVLYLKEYVKAEFRKQTTIEYLMLNIDIPKHTDNTNKYGRLFLNSCGGAIFTHRDVFKDVNGFNPNFKGWGYEDSEFRDRLTIMNRPPKRLKNVFMYHLPHGEHFTHRHKQTIAANYNREIYNKVCAMNKKQCEKYIKSWKL